MDEEILEMFVKVKAKVKEFEESLLDGDESFKDVIIITTESSGAETTNIRITKIK